MLNKQKITIPLTVLREDVDDKMLPDGALIKLVNAQFDKQGRISKRDGYVALLSSDTLGNDIDTIDSIIPIDDEQLIALGDEEAWHYNSDEWRKLNDYIPSYATIDSVFSSQEELTVLDCSSCDDVDFYVYGTSDIGAGYTTLSYTSIYVLGVSRDTKQILFNELVASSVIIAGCTHIQDTSDNDYCLVVYIDSSTKLLKAASFNMNGVSAGTQTTSFALKDSAAAARTYVSLAVSVNNSKDVAWVGLNENGIGQYGICNFSYDASTPAGLTGITATVNTAGLAELTGGSIIDIIPYHTGDSMVVLYIKKYYVNTAVSFRLYIEVYNTSRSLTSSGDTKYPNNLLLEIPYHATALAVGWRTTSGGSKYLVALLDVDGGSMAVVEAQNATTSVPVIMSEMSETAVSLVSKRLSSSGSSIYAMLTLVDYNKESPTQFFAKIDLTNYNFDYVSKCLINSGRYHTGYKTDVSYMPKSIANLEYSSHKISVSPIYSASNPWKSSEIVKITNVFIDGTSQRVIYDKHDQLTYLAGGLLKHYDNYRIANSTLDSIPSVNISSTTGGSLSAGAYQVAAHVELIDAQGNITRSGVAISDSETVDANDKLSVFVYYRTNELSTSNTFAKLKIYRTTANGTIFYLDTIIDVDDDGLTFLYLTQADSSITSNQILFTTSGELEPLPIPSSNFILSHKNRLFLAGADEKNKLYYSKERVVGFGAEFYTALSKDYSEEIVALGKVGEFLYVFSTDSVSYIAGNGPDSVGLNDTFSDFIEVSKEIGCINKYSVVSTDDGVFFQSRKGMYMINKANQLTYIGGPIEDTLASAFRLLRGVSHPKKAEVRWLLSSNKMIVYNYEFNAWCTHELTPSGFGNAVDIASKDGNFWVAFNDGVIWKETENIYSDDGEFIEFYVRTGWIDLEQLNQLKRVYDLYIHGNMLYSHNLVVSVYLDYNSEIVTGPYTTNFNTDDAFGGVGFSYDLRVRLNKQDVKRLKLTMYDEASTTAGESFSLNALSLTVGMKGTTNTKSTEKKYI